MASTRRLPSGRFQGVYYDPVAKKNRYTRGPTFSSKRAAHRAAVELEHAQRSGTYRDPDLGKITYADYFENHWLPNKRGESNTIATFRSHYRVEIKAEFGDVPLERITTELVQRWVTKMIDKGTSPGTIHKRVHSLSAVLGAQKGLSAMRAGRIAENPCKGVDLPYRQIREADVYPADEGFLLMERMTPWYRPLVILAADTGWRWGELNGLLVSDFSEDMSRVRLTRTLLEVPRSQTGLPSNFSYKLYPKERRRRPQIGLSPEVSAAIASLVKARQLFPSDRLFSVPADKSNTLPKRTELWPAGQPISRGNFRTRHWLPAHRDPETGEQDIRERRFHDLRGSHISWLLAAGVDISAVQARVGHTQLSTTQAYVDALPDADLRALEGMAAVRARVLRGAADPKA